MSGRHLLRVCLPWVCGCTTHTFWHLDLRIRVRGVATSRTFHFGGQELSGYVAVLITVSVIAMSHCFLQNSGAGPAA
jgi:hypothetical protein